MRLLLRACGVLTVLLLAALTAAPAQADPIGANKWSCKPSSAHPRPVVLVHGTFANMDDDWVFVSPLLAGRGYCVFTLNYGGSGLINGTGPVAGSAGQLATFVDRVRAATGADQVDLVGHSQGGMMPRYYLKYLGGAAKVHTLVGIVPSNHGTTASGLLTLVQLLGLSGTVADICPACADQTIGSALLTNLNAGGDTVPGVKYTVITTWWDEVVTPYTSAYLSGSNVTNIKLQSHCPLDVSDHLVIVNDPVAQRYLLNALDPAHAVTNFSCLFPL